MSLVLAVDIGTGSCRSALYNQELQRLSNEIVEYTTQYPNRIGPSKTLKKFSFPFCRHSNTCLRETRSCEKYVLNRMPMNSIRLNSIGICTFIGNFKKNSIKAKLFLIYTFSLQL